jgi:hypothetical protein
MSACRAHWSAHRLGTLSNSIAGAIGMGVGLATIRLFEWLGLAVAIAGAGLLVVTGLRSFLWQRAFREARKCHEDISVVFDEEHIHVESAEGKSDLNWGFYSWHLDTADHVILYMTKRAFSVIPIAAFSGTDELNEFMQ